MCTLPRRSESLEKHKNPTLCVRKDTGSYGDPGSGRKGASEGGENGKGPPWVSWRRGPSPVQGEKVRATTVVERVGLLVSDETHRLRGALSTEGTVGVGNGAPSPRGRSSRVSQNLQTELLEGEPNLLRTHTQEVYNEDEVRNGGEEDAETTVRSTRGVRM